MINKKKYIENDQRKAFLGYIGKINNIDIV